MGEHLFCAQRSCHIPKSGSASNMLSTCAFLIRKCVWEFLKREGFSFFFASITSSGTLLSFLVQPLALLFMLMSLLSLSSPVHIWSLSNGEWWRYLHSHNQLDLNSICVGRRLLPALVLLFLGCTSTSLLANSLFWLFMSYAFYHCKKRRPHHYALCCLRMNWITNRSDQSLADFERGAMIGHDLW